VIKKLQNKKDQLPRLTNENIEISTLLHASFREWAIYWLLQILGIVVFQSLS